MTFIRKVHRSVNAYANCERKLEKQNREQRVVTDYLYMLKKPQRIQENDIKQFFCFVLDFAKVP